MVAEATAWDEIAGGMRGLRRRKGSRTDPGKYIKGQEEEEVTAKRLSSVQRGRRQAGKRMGFVVQQPWI